RGGRGEAQGPRRKVRAAVHPEHLQVGAVAALTAHRQSGPRARAGAAAAGGDAQRLEPRVIAWVVLAAAVSQAAEAPRSVRIEPMVFPYVPQVDPTYVWHDSSVLELYLHPVEQVAVFGGLLYSVATPASVPLGGGSTNP